MKKKILKYSAELLLMIILVAGFIIINKQIDKKQAIYNENASEYNYHSDSVTVVDGKIVCKGWCYRFGCDTPKLGSEEAANFKVIFFDESAELNDVEDLESASIMLDTVRTERNDVYETFSGAESYEHDYSYSGYEASIDLTKVDLTGHDYVVAYRYGDKNNHLVRTGVHLNKIIQ